MFNYKFLIFILVLFLFSCQSDPIDSYAKWETITIDFEGPESNESAAINPFTDYRLEVTFIHSKKKSMVPGYFAADGNAAESSATEGKIWRVHFVPDETGEWTYEVSFRTGKNIAAQEDPTIGKAVAFDGQKGSFIVGAVDTTKAWFAKGRLAYVDQRYLQYQETKEYFLKGGPNSPENFLAYKDIDGTYPSDTTKNFIKSYTAHIKDWKTGDPVWQNEKGKGIIGSLNYLADKGMNVIYFLTMNIEGDGRDVWPYLSHQEFDRFDCSKLDQWNIIFNHAQQLGIMLHFVTQETENELLLDNGNTLHYRKLYYRELIARYAHHLMITWNLGEENGPANFTPQAQNDRQRKSMAAYIKQLDPYDNYLVIHTHSWPEARDPIIDSLYGFQYIDGLSLQIDKRTSVHHITKQYIDQSKKAGRIWVSAMDEIGKYYMGAMPDKINPHHDTLRQEVLWGHLMAGGPGVEWYFGYNFPPADLDCEDWRSRNNLWEQTDIALQFFKKHLSFWKMDSRDDLIDSSQGYCLATPGKQYAIYLKEANKAINLNLDQVNGDYTVSWYNPRKGGPLQKGSITEIRGLGPQDLGLPPNDPDQDWVILINSVY